MPFVVVPAGAGLHGLLPEPSWSAYNLRGFWSTITRSYWMSRTEVTQGQWRALTGVNPSVFQNPDDPTEFDQHPVENISWTAAVAYANHLSTLHGLDTCYDLLPLGCEGTPDNWGTGTTTCIRSLFLGPACQGYRLPTSAEWERAARGGSDANSPTANESPTTAEVNTIGWSSSNSGNRTHAVGQLLPNNYGLVDMFGNIAEFVYGDPTDEVFWPSENFWSVPLNTSFGYVAGGDYTGSPGLLRPANRTAKETAGFRLIRTRL